MSKNHLVSLNFEGWSLWKWFQLRSAGFPADGAIALGSDEVQDLLDRLFASNQNFTEIEKRIRERLEELSSGQGTLANDAERNQHRLRKRKSLTPIGDEQFDHDLEKFGEAKTALHAEESAAIAALDDERLRSSGVLRAFAEDPLFREAIAWQNHGILGAAIASYLRSAPGASNAKARDRQRLIAKYIQRYTLKNDTIGFFGPTTWGIMDPQGSGFDLTPGPLIVRRETFFEYWPIGTLVEQWNQSSEVLPICSLRMRLGAWMSDQEYVTREGKRTEMTRVQAAILGMASKTDTVGEIVERVVEMGLAETHESAYEIVRQLVRSQHATAKIEVPMEICRPEEWLRTLLVKLPPSETREEMLATLSTLETGLKGVQGAAGDAEQLCVAIRQLEQDFNETTAISAKRGHGQVYAGRQIFFEECVRGGELTIGGSFIDSLSAPLGLLLKSTRWYTYQIGKRYRAAFSAVFRELSATRSDAEIPLMDFQIATTKLFRDDKGETEIIATVLRELRRRWEEVLQIDACSSSRLAIRSEDIAARVEKLFAAPCPGWPTATYQSPDIMLVARSSEDVAVGKFEAVLGELHTAVSTIPAMTPFSLHPDKDEIARASSADFSLPPIAPVQTSANRVSATAIAPDTINLEDKAARSWRPREQVLVGGDLFVQEQNGYLEVVNRETGERFDVIRFMDYLLSNAVSANFSLLPKKPRMPRVTIDNLIISRERWTFSRAEFDVLLGGTNTPAERFVAVSKWVRERGLPRFMFAVVPNEPKPVYVDFASLILVDIFLLFLAKASKLSLSEMLPGHGEHWLESDSGERYASELRFVAVDPVAWNPEL